MFFKTPYRELPEDPRDLKIRKLEKQLNHRKSILRFVIKFLRIFFKTRMMRKGPQIVTKEVPVVKWYSIETQYKAKAWKMPNGTYAGYYNCPRFNKLVNCYSHNGIIWYSNDTNTKIGFLFGEQEIITTLQQQVANLSSKRLVPLDIKEPLTVLD
jgi:hypothetical protein